MQLKPFSNRAQLSELLWVFVFALAPGCSNSPGEPVGVRQSNEQNNPFPEKKARPVAHVGEVDLSSVPEPSQTEPVTAVMLIRLESSATGTTAKLFALVRIARAHYVHAASETDKTFAPLAIDLVLPNGVEAIGDWEFPKPEIVHGNSPGYRTSVVLQRSIRALPTAKFPLELTAEMQYQACNDELCWPPGKIQLTASLSDPHSNKVIR
jgi:hypothetical protein